jgi:hypothetical protein
MGSLTPPSWPEGRWSRTGYPNDALKLFQLGRFHFRWFVPGGSTSATSRADDSRLSTVIVGLILNSATAYAVMNGPNQAKRYLAEAREGVRAPRCLSAREHGSRDCGNPTGPG